MALTSVATLNAAARILAPGTAARWRHTAAAAAEAAAVGRVPRREGVVVPQTAPYAVTVAAGKALFWCACGRSARQPYCDGSHKGSGVSPVKYVPAADGTVYLCGCKHTANRPLCDGSHTALA